MNRRPNAAVAMTCAGLLALASGCSASSNAGHDLKILTCSSAAGGRPTASGQITNHSAKTSTYAFSVNFLDAAGNRVTVGAALVGRVASKATAEWHAAGATVANGALHCTTGGVTRTVTP